MNHLSDLQDALSQNDLNALLLTSPMARLYATGVFSSDGIVLVTPSGGFLFTDSRYIEAARTQATGFAVALIRGEKGYEETVGALLKTHNIKTLGFEQQTLTVGRYEQLRKAWSEVTWTPAQSLLDKLRLVKSPEEIKKMRNAQRVAETAYLDLLPNIRPGLTERQVRAALIEKMYRAGADALAFDPIVVSGPHSALPHGQAGDRTLRTGDFLILDFGVVVEHYCSDTTRTVAIGSATPEMRRIYDIVLRAQRDGIARARAGMTGADIHNAALETITRAGHGENFGHGFGHCLGLEVHEPGGAAPSQTEPLPAGAVLSAEPGIYLPGCFGVRIEDVIVLKEDGCENLTTLDKTFTVL